MPIGLINCKIYLKEKEIGTERLIFKDNDKIIVFLNDMKDILHFKSNDSLDIYFNDTILLNCEVNEFDELKKHVLKIMKLKETYAANNKFD